LLLLELQPAHLYQVRPRKDRRGFDLISNALSFGRLWYAEPNAVSNAIGYAIKMFATTGSVGHPKANVATK